MKNILFLLALMFVLIGCQTRQTNSVNLPILASSSQVINAPNIILTILEQSTRFNVFSQLHTNNILQANYKDTINILDNALTNGDSSAITVRNQLEQQEPIVFQNLTSQFNLLTWYSTNTDNYFNGISAIKKGIVDVIQN